MPISCPKRYRAADSDAAWLFKFLGPAKFAALQQRFGGRRLWVPKAGTRASCLTCLDRDACILEWRASGRRVDEIGRYLGVSPKTVYRVLERCNGSRPPQAAGSSSHRRRHAA
jgi:hypothetical protein